MSVRGPADMPPARDGQGGEAQAPGAAQSDVLSLAERKAERRRQRETGAGGPPARQANLLRMEARKGGKGGPARGRGERAGGRGRRDLDDDDGFESSGAAPIALPRPATAARPRARHWGVLLSFVLIVALPVAVAAWYLWDRASPRYASMVGFSVRTEDSSSALDMLGGMMALGSGGSSSTDTDILYRYIQSQEIVAAVDARLDLRALWAKGDPERDPVFAYHPPGTIEDLHDHWGRMVSVYNDSATGLLDIEAQAFTPEDARAIAQAIYEQSQTLINDLSDVALADMTRISREELEAALDGLKVAREAVTRFRNANQIVDPTVSMQSQMGLLSRLEDQMAQALIELDVLRETASDDDPRIQQMLDRVDVIQRRMDEERAKFGVGAGRPAVEAPQAGGAEDFATLFADYERLQVDLEFAQQSYVAARAAYDSALAEGRRQSRYLAAHVNPTLAERAEYPQRWQTTLLTALFATLAWLVLTLGAYALRDRR